MSNLPHVAVGQPATEEHLRVFEAFLRAHDIPVAGSRRTAATMNEAVDWWNHLDQPTATELPSDARLAEIRDEIEHDSYQFSYDGGQAARELLAEVDRLRRLIGTPADPADVFEPGHTYRSENGYFEFHCERRIGEYALGIETVLKDWPIQAGLQLRKWATIGPSVGYTDVTADPS